MLEQFFFTTGHGTCSAMFLELLNMSISASYVIIAVMIARWILRKAPKRIRCFLWLLVSIRLVCPVTIESVFSLIPTQDAIEAEIVYDQNPQIHTGITIVDRPINQYMEMHLAPKEVTSVNPLQIVAMFAAIVWVIGIVVMLGFLFYSWVRLKNQVRTAVPKEVAGVKIYQSENIATPFLFGLLKPRIYIPFSVAEQDLTYVVLHEQAHDRRRDYLIKPIAYLLLTVYWFNPLLWVAYILLCRDIELACDELVIRECEKQQNDNDEQKEAFRKLYSQALLSCAVSRKMISACPVAFGEIGVKARVKNVLYYKKPTFWVLVVMVVLCITIPLCFMTQKKEEPQEIASLVQQKVIGSDTNEETIFLNVSDEQNLLDKATAEELTILQEQIAELEEQTAMELEQLNQMRKNLAEKKAELIEQIKAESPDAEQQLKLLEEKAEELEAVLKQMESNITGIKDIPQNVPTLEEQNTDELGYAPLMISEQNYDIILADSMAQLQEWFPDYYEEQEQTTQYADLNLDGYEETVSMKNLGYCGGDGGYLITVTDGKTQKEIELPHYDKESGFPFEVLFQTSDDFDKPFYTVRMENMDIATISLGAVYARYEQIGQVDYLKERYLQETESRILTGDAASGFCIEQGNDDERPSLVIKTYLSGCDGHSDCIGYGMTMLQLQDDGTWEESYQFLPVY